MMVTFDTNSGKPLRMEDKSKTSSSDRCEEGNTFKIQSKKHQGLENGESPKTAMQIIEDGKDFFRFRQTSRSKNGCLICKVRKKKCDEKKPVCQECSRLNKGCVWIDHDKMDEEEIRELKEKAEKEEESSKLRKRKSKSDSSSNKTRKTQYNVFVPGGTAPSTSVKKHRFVEANGKVSPVSSANINNTTHEIIFKSKVKFPNSSKPVSSELDIVSPKMTTSHDIISETDTSLGNNQVGDSLATRDDESDSESVPPLEIYTSNVQMDHHTSFPLSFSQFIRDITNPRDSVNYMEKQNQARADQSAIRSPGFSALVDGVEQELLRSPLAYNDYLQYMNIDLSPELHPSWFPNLTNTGYHLLNYYIDELSTKMSISPVSQNESNPYRNIFLPLAHNDSGVLYGLLAWAGFHLGGEWKAEGEKYVEMALAHLFRGGKNYITSPDDNRESLRTKLATLLVLCGAEICKGDVKNWSLYLNWGSEVFNSTGGILNFNQSTHEYWLVSNFAYHDILASSTRERGTYFPPSDYQRIFEDPHGYSRGKLSPILGVSKNLYKIIGDISTLAFEDKRYLDEYYERDSLNRPETNEKDVPTSYNHNELTIGLSDGRISSFGERTDASRSINDTLLKVIAKSKELEEQIENSKPDPRDLENMTDKELEWQLTIFEAFQLSTKLFLRQSIMKCNPSSLDSQLLYTNLVQCIDIIMETNWRTTLVFPVFIAGIHCVTQYDRNLMRKRIDRFIKLYGPWNVSRVAILLERVWKENANGDKIVDWYAILKELDWDLNFA